MPIRLQPRPTFKFSVEFAQPGSEELARFTLVGRHMRQSTLRAWGARAKEMDGNDPAFLLEAIAGWENVTDEDGQQVKFSAEAFAELVDGYPGSALQIFSTYLKELSAGRQKN